MKRMPRNGRGSNQYRTRPGEPPLSRATAADVAVGDTEPDIEDVAWTFHPERGSWERRGFPSRADAEPWHNEGFTPIEAQQWREVVGPAEEAVAWRSRGFTVKGANTWLEEFDTRGLELTATEAFAWTQNDFGPVTAASYTRRNVTPDTAKQEWDGADFSEEGRQRWGDTGLSATEVDAWLDAGVDEPHVMLTWGYHARFTPSDAPPWQAAGFEADDASEWRSYGFTVTQAAPWYNEGYTALAAAEARRDGQDTPPDDGLLPVSFPRKVRHAR